MIRIRKKLLPFMFNSSESRDHENLSLGASRSFFANHSDKRQSEHLVSFYFYIRNCSELAFLTFNQLFLSLGDPFPIS